MSCFHLLALVNTAATDIYVHVFEYLFAILLFLYLGVKPLGHTIILCLTFWGTFKLFSYIYFWKGKNHSINEMNLS